MKKLAMFALSAAALVSSSAFAQAITRAEVTQQLVQAEQNGSQFVTEASYPDVSPIYSSQVARLKSQGYSDVGGMPAGTSASGLRVAMTGSAAPQPCVGPNSFCNLYAGS
jgi:Domain of unknown function (DUF4148)